MLEFLKNRVKKIDWIDLTLVKWSVIAAVLFIITIWPAVMNLVISVNPWYFLIATIIFAIRPFYRVYIK